MRFDHPDVERWRLVVFFSNRRDISSTCRPVFECNAQTFRSRGAGATFLAESIQGIQQVRLKAHADERSLTSRCRSRFLSHLCYHGC